MGIVETENEKYLNLYQNHTLAWIDCNTLGYPDKTAARAQAYKARYEHVMSICHMLRKVVADKKLPDIYKTYTNLRAKSCEPVLTQTNSLTWSLLYQISQPRFNKGSNTGILTISQ